MNSRNKTTNYDNCNIYMCSPTGLTTVAMDGITQLPVEVHYAIYDNKKNQPSLSDQDKAAVSLLNYQEVIWKDDGGRITYPEGEVIPPAPSIKINPPTRLNEDRLNFEGDVSVSDLNIDFACAGWQSTTQKRPDSDVLQGSDGCDGIVPSDDLQYSKRTIYLSHTYATEVILDTNSADPKCINFNPFIVSASISFGNTTWNTTKNSKNSATNTDNTTLNLVPGDGTPNLKLYAYTNSGKNTIFSNGNMQIAFTVELQISTPASQGGTGSPLSTQNTALCSLVTFENGAQLDGYNSGQDTSYGKWQVATTGTDWQEATYTASNLCQGIGSNFLSGAMQTNTFYISHSLSYASQQVVPVAVSVSYTPPTASSPVTWCTDKIQGRPARGCVTLFAAPSG